MVPVHIELGGAQLHRHLETSEHHLLKARLLRPLALIATLSDLKQVKRLLFHSINKIREEHTSQRGLLLNLFFSSKRVDEVTELALTLVHLPIHLEVTFHLQSDCFILTLL